MPRSTSPGNSLARAGGRRGQAVAGRAIERMEADSTAGRNCCRCATRPAALDAARQKARHDKDLAHQAAMRHQSRRPSCSDARGDRRTNSQVSATAHPAGNPGRLAWGKQRPLGTLKLELEEQLEQRLRAEGESQQPGSRWPKPITCCAKGTAAGDQSTGREVRAEIWSDTASPARPCRCGAKPFQAAGGQWSRDRARAGNHAGGREGEAEWQLSYGAGGLPHCPARPDQPGGHRRIQPAVGAENYLDLQNEDLQTALETLQSAIRKIDKETRNRFRRHLRQGQQRPAGTVPAGVRRRQRLPGNDRRRPADTGITIMARPPGKKNSTIHLLSGGEKAPTAIALVFSIFQLNPAPFCMLDEVDAPWTTPTWAMRGIVKEMSEKGAVYPYHP